VQEIWNRIEQMQRLFVYSQFEGVGVIVQHEMVAPLTPPLVEDVDIRPDAQ
jgi:hypothetical protein